MWAIAGAGAGTSQPQRREDVPDVKLYDSDISNEELSNIRRTFISEGPERMAPVKREDIVGLDHMFEMFDDIVDFLQNFRHYDRINARLDSGVLLQGPFGSGKTLCARYIATVSGARYVDMRRYPKREAQLVDRDIAELFLLAQAYVKEQKKPLILFWDEFDIFALQRDKCQPEQKNAVTQLITELSGVEGRPRGVFIIATTNSADNVEPALLRPGRIGKKIKFTSPSRPAKRLLLEHYVQQHPAVSYIDVESLSFMLSANALPATIEEIVAEAWLQACRRTRGTRKKRRLTNDDLAKALLIQLRGIPDSVTLTDEALRREAIYEAGRALVARTLGRPTQVVALSRHGYEDAKRVSEAEQMGSEMLTDVLDKITVLHAGIAAQKFSGIPRNRKGEEEYAAATQMAQDFVEKLGGREGKVLSMAALAQSRDPKKLPTTLGVTSEYSNKNFEEIAAILEELRERAERILAAFGQKTIERLALKLIEKEYFLQNDIDAFLTDEARMAASDDTATAKTQKVVGFAISSESDSE